MSWHRSVVQASQEELRAAAVKGICGGLRCPIATAFPRWGLEHSCLGLDSETACWTL